MDDSAHLSAPLLSGAALDGAWADHCAELSMTKEKLSEISSQDVLALLRASFSTPRVLHLLRCSPSVDHDALHSLRLITYYDQLSVTSLTPKFRTVSSCKPVYLSRRGIWNKKSRFACTPCLFRIRSEHRFYPNNPRLHSGSHSLSFRHIF